jgi:hypothetical protein
MALAMYGSQHMPREVGSKAVPSREEVVVQAFRSLMKSHPGGWYSATQLCAQIATDLNLRKESSTVRENWRFGRKSLSKKAYLGKRLFEAKRGPEVRYFLRAIDGKISVPADQYSQMSDAERDLLFPLPVRTQEDRQKLERAGWDRLGKGLALAGNIFLASTSTEALEQELLRRLTAEYDSAEADLIKDQPQLHQEAHRRIHRRPTAEFGRELLTRLQGSEGRPSNHLVEPRTPIRHRASSELRRRQRPSRTA